MRSQFTIAQCVAMATPSRGHHFPWFCRQLSSQKRVRSVVNMGGVVKTLRRSNSLSRNVFSMAGLVIFFFPCNPPPPYPDKPPARPNKKSFYFGSIWLRFGSVWLAPFWVRFGVLGGVGEGASVREKNITRLGPLGKAGSQGTSNSGPEKQ